MEFGNSQGIGDRGSVIFFPIPSPQSLIPNPCIFVRDACER